jgi:hypothetical protein
MSFNGTDQAEELCPFPPAIANAGSLPLLANTAAALIHHHLQMQLLLWMHHHLQMRMQVLGIQLLRI